jgi:hypothetical protein
MITVANVGEVVATLKKKIHDDVFPNLHALPVERVCFAVRLVEGKTHMVWALGICVKDEAGYHPLPEALCSNTVRESVDTVASMMNHELGHDDRKAALIIATTMRNERVASNRGRKGAH